jgi:hypothetical protein
MDTGQSRSFGSQPRVIGVKEKKALTLIDVGIGHHLIDISLAYSVLWIVDCSLETFPFGVDHKHRRSLPGDRDGRRDRRYCRDPVAVSVVSGTQLAQSNLTSLESVSARLPAVKIVAGPLTDYLNIRGVGSGQNAGFEHHSAVLDTLGRA